MADFSRVKDGFRFIFGGMKLNAPPDAVPPNKYPLAINVRALRETSTQTRPGQSLRFVTGENVPVTDIGTSAAIGTDDLPRIFIRNAVDHIYLDNGVLVGVLAGAGTGPGAVLLPFRPNQSPTPYMYAANGSDYQKFLVPGPSNAVVAKKVGIAEPQSPPEAGNTPQTFVEVLPPAGSVWVPGGTASALTAGDRSADQIVQAFQDPVQPQRWILWVGTGVQYQRGEVLNLTGVVPLQTIIEDVIPPLSLTLTVAAIFYFAGTSGRCIVVPKGLSAPNPRPGQSMFSEELVAQLRRGSLIQIGSETCLVRSISVGPNGQVSIETLTANTHAVGETITGVSAVVVNGVVNPSAVVTGAPIVGDKGNVQNFSVASGIGTITMGSVGGPNGTVISRPAVFLNGWGPNGHVGAYEMGQDQGFNWGLDPGSTNAYTNPANAVDGDITTFAQAVLQHTHQYSGCVWKFNFAGPPPSNFLTLNINSSVPANGSGGLVITLRSAGIWYSLDGGVSWQQIYNQGTRAQQWDTISLPAGQNLNLVQVMAFMDAHDDMAHSVYEINITSAPSNPVLSAVGAFQEDDYVHFSVKVSDLTKLTEAKILIDVGDGSFTQNFYYYSVRPNDIVQAVANATTQLSLAQILLQRRAIAEEAQGKNESIPADSVAGNNQWSEIWFPIAQFLRVGGDMTRTLANAQGVQFLFNVSGAITASLSSLCLVGGGQPDVGDVGAPLLYRVQPRDSRTGATGNPSPATRYGTLPRRQAVAISLPNPSYDQQIDTWDIFRFGGAVTSWRYIGSTPALPVAGVIFTDNYDDAAAQAGRALDFDNHEPWPSIDVPFQATATQVVGTVALVTIPGATSAERFLPGNLVQIAGQNVYTLWNRPVQVSGGVFLFQFVENAGFAGNVSVAIYEPNIARQFLPYMWGPDASGTMFAVGDPLRAGTLYFAKNNNPDSAPDKYNMELCTPSEPLIGGEVVDGLSFVGSTERWWALYPEPNNPVQRWNPVQQPVSRGLGAPYGHCNDGTQVFFFAKDGIYSTAKGSLTDGDLYNLFPHESVPGQAVTYNGVTIPPPDYSRAGTFRLTHSNGYLYAIYQDSTGAYRCLTLDIRRAAWCLDQYSPLVSAMYHPTQQAGTLLTNTRRYDELLQGTVDGRVAAQADLSNDLGGSISCTLATFEFNGGDVRTNDLWGDLFIDAVPAAKGQQLTIRPMAFGAQVAVTTQMVISANRVQQPVSLDGGILESFLGIFLTWTDNYAQQAVPTVLYAWQPSFIDKPENINDRQTDWDNAGMEGAKWFQGFTLRADTFGATIAISIRDAETNTLHPFTPQFIKHTGESEITYSFAAPFIAHLVRIEPNAVINPWRLFGVKWIAEPTPSPADVWETQGTSFGLKGYLHVRQVSAAYASVGNASLIITTFDGQSPQAIPLPATGGVMKKVTFPVTANKGQLYFFRVAAVNPDAGLRLFLPDWEVLVGEWGRNGGYDRWTGLGGDKGDGAKI